MKITHNVALTFIQLLFRSDIKCAKKYELDIGLNLVL